MSRVACIHSSRFQGVLGCKNGCLACQIEEEVKHKMQAPEYTMRRCVCINCMGQGTLHDGGWSYNSETKKQETTPSSKCPICRGKGLVNISPISDEDDSRV